MIKLNVSRLPSSDPLGVKTKRKPKDWEEYALASFRNLNSILDLWQDSSRDARPLTRSHYILTFDIAQANFTGFASQKAIESKLGMNNERVVYDHCLSPQFVTRMILDNPEIYLENYKNFKEIFWECSKTIMVTSKENTNLSKLTENNGYSYSIKVPTSLKYKHLGINLYKRVGKSRKWDKCIMVDNIIDVPENLVEYEKFFLEKNIDMNLF